MFGDMFEYQRKDSINIHIRELFRDAYMYGDAIDGLSLPELEEVKTMCKNIITKVDSKQKEILELSSESEA